MPWPLSETVISICGPRPLGESTRAPTAIVPGGPVASMALPRRLISTWRSAAASDRAVAGAAEHAADGLDHALHLRLDHRELGRLLGGQVLAQEELSVAEHRVERRPQLVGDGGGHLPEGGEPLAAADLELRAPQLLVGPLQLAVRVGQLLRRLAHARLEPGGQVLEARQHAVEAPCQKGEFASPEDAHARAQLARLGAAHAVHESSHRTPDAAL